MAQPVERVEHALREHPGSGAHLQHRAATEQIQHLRHLARQAGGEAR